VPVLRVRDALPRSFTPDERSANILVSDVKTCKIQVEQYTCTHDTARENYASQEYIIPPSDGAVLMGVDGISTMPARPATIGGVAVAAGGGAPPGAGGYVPPGAYGAGGPMPGAPMPTATAAGQVRRPLPPGGAYGAGVRPVPAGRGAGGGGYDPSGQTVPLTQAMLAQHQLQLQQEHQHQHQQGQLQHPPHPQLQMQQAVSASQMRHGQASVGNAYMGDGGYGGAPSAGPNQAGWPTAAPGSVAAVRTTQQRYNNKVR